MLCGAPSKQKPNRDPAMPLCHIPVPHEVRSELWPISNLQECGRAMSGCGNQRDRDLAVLLLAELAAIPMRDTDRMRTVLREARVVDDPGIDRSVPHDLWQHQRARLGHNNVVRPCAFRHEMQKRLMLGSDTLRRRHWQSDSVR